MKEQKTCTVFQLTAGKFIIAALPAGMKNGAATGPESNSLHLLKLNIKNHKTEDLGRIEDLFGSSSWMEPGKSLIFGRTINGLTNLWKYDLSHQTTIQVTSGSGPDFSPMNYKNLLLKRLLST